MEGRDPRRADQLRGQLRNIAGANQRRNEAAESQIASAQFLIRVEEMRARVVRALVLAYPDLGVVRAKLASNESFDMTIDEVQIAIGRNVPTCRQCDYCLFGLPMEGKCPECGTPYRIKGAEPNELRTHLARSLGVAREDFKGSDVIEQLIRDRVRATPP